ncbi:MAG: hypothetical protein EXR67_05725 [Dehalococcoidia bacterium]|nr:hypothetical protein [Dehalococcoidia bacterium]
MVLFSTDEGLSPFSQTMVALDLETTGLDPQRDAVIEIGAVKFRGREVLGTYTTLINPSRAIPAFVQRLTGIKQTDVVAAPPMAVASGQLAQFMGDLPIVGHNIAFDLGFLTNNRMRFTAPVYDTYDLANIFRPKGEYSLISLARAFKALHDRPHRALSDAQATHEVMMALVDEGLQSDPSVLEELHRLASVAGWPLRSLLREMVAERKRTATSAFSAIPLGGVDFTAIRKRQSAMPGFGFIAHKPIVADVDLMVSMLRPGGAASSVMPSFEHRPQQEDMLRAVAKTLDEGGQLFAEAGTGVGKSLAYLLPAALYALQKGVRVVVSTNTIGLQEQLVTKDLPLVSNIIATAFGESVPPLRFAQLKGRSNYLCVRRWASLRSSQTLGEDEARVLGKLLLWLQTTASGDRGELRLNGKDTDIWMRLSAQGARGCPMNGETPCFVQAAYQRAEGAEVLVVNHALLLADLALGGSLLPKYEHLIIDEAHHLEAQATDQFGFELSQEAMTIHFDVLAGARGLNAQAVASYAAAPDLVARRQATERAALTLTERVAAARRDTADLFIGIAAFSRGRGDANSGQRKPSLRVTQGVRAQPDWSHIEIATDAAVAALEKVKTVVGQVSISLDGLDIEEAALVQAELDAQAELTGEIIAHLEEFLLRPEKESVYWIEEEFNGSMQLHAAPLRVSELLKKKLFDEKRAVVLTSATLSTAGSLKPIKELLGAPEASDVVLDSPFDFKRAALLCVPQDMPEPATPTYDGALAMGLIEMAKASKGRAMALFTSNASLRGAAERVRPALELAGIPVLAQGMDGSAAQVLERFQANPQALLLGTASFWEGVDLVGEQLSLLIIVRLPFSVPTDPVFAARSETFEDPFSQYAVPQAVLKFRQGFGRLIRSTQDRGVVVILDRRTTSRSYGQTFVKSLPPCRLITPTLREVPDQIAAWLRQS